MTAPTCTCTVTGRTTRFDPACHYHGENGTMIARVRIPLRAASKAASVAPMAASTKAQLGARVTPELRDRAKARAASDGLSLNEWVERALSAALSTPEVGARRGEDHVRSQVGARTTRAKAPIRACPSCGAVGGMHQRGCVKA